MVYICTSLRAGNYDRKFISHTPLHSDLIRMYVQAIVHACSCKHFPLLRGGGLNSDLGDSGLEEEVCHGRWSEIGGCQSDGCHGSVPGTSLKVELNL